jgi:hypothetical protein
MHLPILHDFHRERVLGVIVKAWEEGDHFKFRALFKATHDVDDAWDKVQKGEYDHVSIYGSRIEGSPSCKHDPTNRVETCVTRQIRLDSISACDENARNSDAIMGIAKSSSRFCNDLTDTFIKAETQNSNLIHGTQDGVNKPMDEKEDKKCPLEKGDEHVGLLKKIWETLQQLVESDKKVHASIGKSEENEMEEKKEEVVEKAAIPEVKPVEEVKKAETPKTPEVVLPNYDEIIKAKTDEISKAFATQIAELKAEIAKLKEEPIQKAQVIIADEVLKGEPYGSANYKAVEQLMKRG